MPPEVSANSNWIVWCGERNRASSLFIGLCYWINFLYPISHILYPISHTPYLISHIKCKCKKSSLSMSWIRLKVLKPETVIWDSSSFFSRNTRTLTETTILLYCAARKFIAWLEYLCLGHLGRVRHLLTSISASKVKSGLSNEGITWYHAICIRGGRLIQQQDFKRIIENYEIRSLLPMETCTSNVKQRVFEQIFSTKNWIVIKYLHKLSYTSRANPSKEHV